MGPKKSGPSGDEDGFAVEHMGERHGAYCEPVSRLRSGGTAGKLRTATALWVKQVTQIRDKRDREEALGRCPTDDALPCQGIDASRLPHALKSRAYSPRDALCRCVLLSSSALSCMGLRPGEVSSRHA